MSITLPLELDDGLLLRWATQADIEKLAQFNITVHSDDPDNPQRWLGEMTRDLMAGKHPTTAAADFTLVIDEHNGRKIVSSLNLISQTWTYDGIPFGVGRIELVGTDPAYRRRGLVRQQMMAVHGRSAEKGEFIQAITGIPWYYRQFGYEMTLNLGGGREFFWVRQKNDMPHQEENFQIRQASEADIPVLEELYNIHCGQNLVKFARDHECWRYCLSVAHHETPARLKIQIIENNKGQAVAYADIKQWGAGFTIREMGVKNGVSWREVSLFLVRQLKKQADMLNKERETPITNINFSLGETHPVYEALGNQLERLRKPYAWFIRVPELHNFLRHIAPVLEQRMTSSVIAGHSGRLRLNFYRDSVCLTFDHGRLTKIEGYVPAGVEDADALFPDLTFLQLLFGYRSLHELDYAFADCYTSNEEAAVLLNALFPRRSSDVSALN